MGEWGGATAVPAAHAPDPSSAQSNQENFT